MSQNTIGVDISKDHFDAHRMSDGTSRRFDNDKAGHSAFIDWMGQTDEPFCLCRLSGRNGEHFSYVSYATDPCLKDRQIWSSHHLI